MTNTILTPEQIDEIGDKHRPSNGPKSMLDYTDAIVAATLAELVQRAGVEEVLFARMDNDGTVSQRNDGQPDAAWIEYKHSGITAKLYPPEAIAQLQARIEALSAEVERLKNNPRQSAFGKESEKLADDYLTLSRAFNELLAERDQLSAQLEAMEARKDAAYLERNQLVALVSKLFPAGTKRTAIEGWSDDWHGCVYIDLPTGQASWHYHDSQAYLFEHLPPYVGDWDGHSTEQKYERIAQLEAQGEAVEPVAWFAFGDSNGPVPLELYGWDEKACKHAVLTNARSVGWKGTLDGYLYQQGWTIRPVYTHPAPAAPVVELTDEQKRNGVQALKTTLYRGGSNVHLPAESWIEDALCAALQAAPAQPVNQVLVDALKHIANDNWPDADLSAEEYAALVLAQAQAQTSSET